MLTVESLMYAHEVGMSSRPEYYSGYGPGDVTLERLNKIHNLLKEQAVDLEDYDRLNQSVPQEKRTNPIDWRTTYCNAAADAFVTLIEELEDLSPTPFLRALHRLANNNWQWSEYIIENQNRVDFGDARDEQMAVLGILTTITMLDERSHSRHDDTQARFLRQIHKTERPVVKLNQLDLGIEPILIQEEKDINSLKIGEYGYCVSWSIKKSGTMEEFDLELNLHQTTFLKEGGTVSLCVIRVKKGYITLDKEGDIFKFSLQGKYCKNSKYNRGVSNKPIKRLKIGEKGYYIFKSLEDDDNLNTSAIALSGCKHHLHRGESSLINRTHKGYIVRNENNRVVLFNKHGKFVQLLKKGSEFKVNELRVGESGYTAPWIRFELNLFISDTPGGTATLCITRMPDNYTTREKSGKVKRFDLNGDPIS